jgi:hypothetical protein
VAKYLKQHSILRGTPGHVTTGIHLEIHKFETKHFGVISRTNIQLNDYVSKTVFVSITQRLITAVCRVLARLIARKYQQNQIIFSSFNNDITNDSKQSVCVCVCVTAERFRFVFNGDYTSTYTFKQSRISTFTA